MRSKARIEVDRPDLPDGVKEAAAAAIAGIWQQASAAARDELHDVRAEAEARVIAAKDEARAAQEQLSTLQAAVDAARAQLAAAQATGDHLRTELESERRAHAASAGRIQELQRTIEEHRVQSQRLQDGFSADLAKAREAAEAANMRADAAEHRALLDIDQERQARSRAEKALDALRVQGAQSEERLLVEAQTATQVNVRQNARIETLELANQDLADQAQRDASASDAMRSQLRAAEDEAARARARAQTLQDVLDRFAAPGASPAVASRPSKSRKT